MQGSCSCNELAVLHRQRGSAKHPAFQGERELARAIVLSKEAREGTSGGFYRDRRGESGG